MITRHEQLKQIKQRLDSRKFFLTELPGADQDDILQEFYNWTMGRRRR